ncbi:hypothetical protein [Yoonia sp. BS5-3]|uniref:Uncharacterized protein n=1 Tax=Yoonia phaeophyticola TaxID=3137369 RepID=A0ABZ2V1Z6_9RHOB
MPLTFRLIFHGLRSIWIAIFLALTIWLVFVPATQAERNALTDSPIAQSGFALTQMRVARLMVHFAPERAANMISRASNGEISPEYAGMLLRHLANGSPTMQPVVTEEPTTRSVGDAKFVTID